MSDQTADSCSSFTAFVLSLASTAAIHFGDLPDPVSGERAELNLEGAAQMIEILALLDRRRAATSPPKSARCSNRCSTSCGMRFVEASGGGKRIIEPRSVVSRRSIAMQITVLGTGTSHGVPTIGCDCAVCRSTDPRDRADAPVDSDRDRLAGDDAPARRRSTSSSTPRPICARRRSRTTSAASTRSSSRTATPITSSASTRCGASTPMQQAAIPCLRRRRDARRPAADVRLHLRRRRRRRRRHPAADAVRDRRAVLARRRRDRAGAAVARPAADSRLPHRRVRLPDRLQPHSRRRRGRCSTACDVSSSTRCATVRTRRTSASTRRSRRVARIGAERAYFTHICHDLPHAATCARLPAGVELAYDGLVVESLTRRSSSGASDACV